MAELPLGASPIRRRMIATGRVSGKTDSGCWPAPDGSIHILADDGTLVDRFNYAQRSRVWPSLSRALNPRCWWLRLAASTHGGLKRPRGQRIDRKMTLSSDPSPSFCRGELGKDARKSFFARSNANHRPPRPLACGRSAVGNHSKLIGSALGIGLLVTVAASNEQLPEGR
jgi:hypothetical protein